MRKTPPGLRANSELLATSRCRHFYPPVLGVLLASTYASNTPHPHRRQPGRTASPAEGFNKAEGSRGRFNDIVANNSTRRNQHRPGRPLSPQR
jgi:hypothetical protein